jgi:hypothetical protein
VRASLRKVFHVLGMACLGAPFSALLPTYYLMLSNESHMVIVWEPCIEILAAEVFILAYAALYYAYLLRIFLRKLSAGEELGW